MKKALIVTLILVSPLFVLGCTTVAEDQPADLTQAVEKTARLSDGTYEVNTQSSTLYWEAFKPIGGHMGGISLEKGELIVKEGVPMQGSFVLDMDSIVCTDVEDAGMNQRVVNHLKSDDFFGVATYPTARFDITRASKYEGSEDFDFVIEGDLSLKNVTEEVIVLAKIGQSENRLTAFAKAEIDRTKFDINFRSGSFFEDLGDKLIKDEFILEMDLVADRL